MMRNKTRQEVSGEFFESVKAQAAYGGEISYGYMAGYLEGFIRNLEHVPEVQAEMQSHIHHYLMDMNRKNSRLVAK
jgi:hypothetical protein